MRLLLWQLDIFRNFRPNSIKPTYTECLVLWRSYMMSVATVFRCQDQVTSCYLFQSTTPVSLQQVCNPLAIEFSLDFKQRSSLGKQDATE